MNYGCLFIEMDFTLPNYRSCKLNCQANIQNGEGPHILSASLQDNMDNVNKAGGVENNAGYPENICVFR
jgi:hypothetical protein